MNLRELEDYLDAMENRGCDEWPGLPTVGIVVAALVVFLVVWFA